LVNFPNVHRQILPVALVVPVMLHAFVISDGEPFDGGSLAALLLTREASFAVSLRRHQYPENCHRHNADLIVMFRFLPIGHFP
jgi:hypothetical protein